MTSFFHFMIFKKHKAQEGISGLELDHRGGVQSRGQAKVKVGWVEVQDDQTGSVYPNLFSSIISSI